MYLAAPTLGNIDHIASLTAWYMAGPAIGLGEKAGKEHGADCGTERRTGCQFRSLRRGGTRARWADRVSRARGLGHGAWGMDELLDSRRSFFEGAAESWSATGRTKRTIRPVELMCPAPAGPMS